MSREVGTPIATSRRVQVGLAVDVFRSIADVLADVPARGAASALRCSSASRPASSPPSRRGTTRCTSSRRSWPPRSRPAAPPILKPAGVAPLAAFALAEIIDELGLPRRHGERRQRPRQRDRRDAGRATRASTWSASPARPQAGVRVAQAAAQTVKRVTLELGGKSAFILLDDTDLAAALPVRGPQLLRQQRPDLLGADPADRAREPSSAEVEDGLAELVGAMRVGDPLEPGDRARPDGQRGPAQTVCAATSSRACRGRRLVAGGAGRARRASIAGTTSGRRCSPASRRTWWSPARRSSGRCSWCIPATARTRPCRSRTTPTTGCPAACGPATRSARSRWRAGCAPARSRSTAGRFNVRAPFGGYKQSGVGRELGEHGLAEYFELTSLQLPAPPGGPVSSLTTRRTIAMPDRDYEDVTVYSLDETAEAELLAKQAECTFIWSNSSGHPLGVIMNYVFRDGSFWLTASSQRARVPAVRRDPRVSIVVSSLGSSIEARKSLTYKGQCVIHQDEATSAWFYPALAAAVRPGDPQAQAAFVRHLDSPRRVVLEIVPEGRIGFDSTQMWRDTPDAARRE